VCVCVHTLDEKFCRLQKLQQEQEWLDHDLNIDTQQMTVGSKSTVFSMHLDHLLLRDASAERGYEIACRLSVCLSVRLSICL